MPPRQRSATTRAAFPIVTLLAIAGGLPVLTLPALAQDCSALFGDDFESGNTLLWSPDAGTGDDFEDGDLEGWNLLDPSSASVFVESGNLIIEPDDLSVWFNASAAALVWRPASGDFKVTAAVSARSLSSPDSPPQTPFRLGGLMARNPNTTSGENYVFIVVGADGNDVSVETKTTVDSVSTFTGPTWPSGDADLRICRIGCTFRLYAREAGGAWDLRETFERPDLPSTLQVGAIAYANAQPADLRISFEAIDFAPVIAQEDCSSD